MRVTSLIAACLLTGCTTIENVDLHTVAVNCNVKRVEALSGGGEAEADVVQRQGALGAEVMRSLGSTIECLE